MTINQTETSEGTVQLGGLARVGAGQAVDQIAVVVAYDLSGSVGGDAGDCDGDGLEDTVLDCELLAIENLERAAAAQGNVPEFGLVPFAGSAGTADVQPQAGIQVFTTPGADLNGNVQTDISEVVRSSSINSGVSIFSPVSAGFGTRFEPALTEACSTIGQSVTEGRTIIFISDGEDSVSNFPLPCAAPAVVQSLAVGEDSQCSGAMQEMADLTGGTCTEVTDPSNLPEVLRGVLSPQVIAIQVSVNGGSPTEVDTTSRPLPASGPTPFTWSTSVAGLAGTNELCITAAGRLGTDQVTVTECVTVDVDAGPGPELPPCPTDGTPPDGGTPPTDGRPPTNPGNPPTGPTVTIPGTAFGSTKLLATKPDRRQSAIVPIEPLKGLHLITLEALEPSHPQQLDQPFEQWDLVGYDAQGRIVFETVATDDLADSATSGTTAVGYYDLTGVTAIRARHARPIESNPNSVLPGDVSFASAVGGRRIGPAEFDHTRFWTIPEVAGNLRSDPIDVEGLTGSYMVELYSSDRFHLRSGEPDQPQEQWLLAALDVDGNVLFETGPSADLPEDLVANRTEVGRFDFTGVAAIEARYAFPDSSTTNSIVPTGVVLRPVGDDQTVTFSDVSIGTGDAVTSPVDLEATLSMAPGTTIASWRSVAYESFSCVEQGIEIGSGDGIPTDGFGLFDPTTRSNGTWVIRLEVTDEQGNVSIQETVITIEGGLKQGRLGLSTADTSVATGGRLPLVVLRAYDTLERRFSSDFGFGWNLETTDYDISSAMPLGGGSWTPAACPSDSPVGVRCFSPGESRFVNVSWPDGTVETFDLVLSADTDPPSPATVEYVTRPGTTSTLRPAPGDEAAFVTADGRLISSETDTSIYDPTRFVLVARDGTEFLIDRDLGLARSTDSNGVSISYDRDGFVSSLGPALRFERDDDGRITSVTEPGGATITYTYDGRGDLVSVVDQNGNETRYSYDGAHRLQTVDDPSPGVALTASYDSSGRLTSVVGADGDRVTIDDEVATRSNTVTSADGNLVTETTFDDRGNPIVIDEVHDGESHVSRFEYNEFDLVTQRTDPIGNTWTVEYDEDLNAIATTDAEGNTWTYDYNDRGLQTAIIDPTGATTDFAYDGAGNLLSTTDANGATVTFTYDDAGNRRTRTDELDRTTTFTYDDAGRVLTETDPSGNATRFGYDNNGDLQLVTAADGGDTAYEYDGRGNVVRVSDPLGRSQVYSYDAGDRLVSHTDAGGFTTSWAYDDAGRPVSSTDGVGGTTSYEYEFGRLITETAADGGVTRYGYDGAGQLRTITDPLGHATTYSYDPAGRLAEVLAPIGDGDTSRLSMTLDGNGRVISSTNPEGETTTIAYDSLGRVTTITDPLGRVTTTGYDAFGNRTSVTDPTGAVERWSYNGVGELISYTDATGARSLLTYDDNGDLAATTDAVARTTTYAYDAVGRRTGYTLPSGDAGSNVYDLAGQVIESTSPGGVTMSLGYDERGLTTSVEDSLGNTATTTHDGVGRVLTRTDARGNPTTFTYDPMGRVLTETDPVGGTVTFGYDLVGRRRSVTDPNGAIRTLGYDDGGRLITTTDALGREATSRYDDAGRSVSHTDARGVTIATSYDEGGQMTAQSSPDGDRRYSYDQAGRLTEMVDGSGITAFAYDDVGRLTGVTSAAGRLAYSYDAAGQRSAMSQPQGTVTYRYGPNGDVAGITNWGGGTTSFTYDADGRPVSIDRSNGVETIHAYDEAGRLTGVTHSVDGTTIADYRYTLDVEGNRTAVVDGTKTETYSLDELNRLTAVTYPDGTSERFGYDAAGYRTSRVARDGTTVTSTFDLAGQLVSDSTGTTFSYDEAGNLTGSSEGDAYRWDAWGDLVGATVDGTTQTYRFDAAGIRVDVDGAGHLWDVGDLPTLVATGPGNADGYVHGPTGILGDGDGWFLSDAIGSVRATTDSSGQVTGTGSYTAFGEPVDPVGLAFGFAGELTDPTGLVHLRARQYDPARGRFTSVDPRQPGGPGTGGWNLYSYSANNPTTLTDPSGEIVGALLLSGRLTVNAALLAQLLQATILAAAAAITAQVILNADLPPITLPGTGSPGGTTPGVSAPNVEVIDDPVLAAAIREQFEAVIEGGLGQQPRPTARPRPIPIPVPDIDTRPDPDEEEEDDLCTLLYPTQVRELMATADVNASRAIQLPGQTVGHLTLCDRTSGDLERMGAAQYPLGPTQQLGPLVARVDGADGPHAEEKLLLSAAGRPDLEKLAIGVGNNFCDRCRGIVLASGAQILPPIGRDRGSKRAIWEPGFG